jgi:ACS family hexuronate transporter-like MFS transporter
MLKNSQKGTSGFPLISPHHYRWYAVFVMWTSQVIYYLIYSSLGVLGPILKKELSLNNTEFGILCGAIGFGTAVAQMPGGIWCDKIGVRKVMISAFIFMASCTFVFSMSETLSLAFFSLVFVGLGVGGSQIAGAKAIIEWFPYTGRATAMGIKLTGGSVGGIAASALLPILLGLYDWRILVKLMSALAFLFIVYFVFTYRDSPEGGQKASCQPVCFRGIWLSLKQIRFLLATAVGIVFLGAQFCFSSYLVLYLTQSLHYSLRTSGMILASSFVIGAVGRVGWGLASDYLFGSREVVLAIIAALGSIIGVALVLLTPTAPLWLLYLLSILSGVSLMGWNGIWLALVGEVARETSTGSDMGLSTSLGSLGLILAPPLFGIAADFFHSFFVPWISLSVCMALFSIVLFLNSSTPVRKSRMLGAE